MTTKEATKAMEKIKFIQEYDPELATALKQELTRQRETIELIASENFTTREVLEAQGTWLTNKYAEGLPSKRYYGGCEYVDIVEDLARDRAKELFNADHANVQPHSGAQANVAVFTAFLKPGDTILGMNLSHGGHLTHGSPVNFSGKFYNIVPYGVNQETRLLDYDEIERLAVENKPKLIIGGASAYSRVIDFARMGEIAKKVGAYLMIDMAHIAGLVAAGLHPSPFPHADFVTSTTHKTLRGPRGGIILCKQEHQKEIDKSVFPGNQGGPLMHTIAAKAVAFKQALEPSFKTYQEQVIKNAQQLAATLIEEGFELSTGGTDNHLVLVDLQNKKLTGKIAEETLDRAGITLNKNTVPFDPESPFVTSGIRIGTPSVTTRGMKESEMVKIGQFIAKTLHNVDNDEILASIRSEILSLTNEFPLYPELDA